jgi:hypothetical protein
MAGTNVWDDFVVSFAGAPAGMTQEFQITSPLTQSVTTNQSTYQPGQPVQLTATETNTSIQAITILNTQDQFIVMGYGGVNLPATNVSSSNPIVTLQPGQSQTFTATWNPSGGQGSSASPSGYYRVLFQDNFQGTTSPQFVIDSPSTNSGTTGSTSGQLPGTSTSSTQNASPVTASLTTNHSTAHSGQPVRLTITLKNVTKKSERLTPDLSTDGITVLEGSTVVSRITRHLLTSKARTLKSGQSIQLTSTWNGKPNQAGLKTLNLGLYSVEVSEGGYSASATIRIE